MIEDLPLAHLAQTGCRDHRGVLEEEERFCSRKNLENDDDDLTLMNDGLKTTITTKPNTNQNLIIKIDV